MLEAIKKIYSITPRQVKTKFSVLSDIQDISSEQSVALFHSLFLSQGISR